MNPRPYIFRLFRPLFSLRVNGKSGPSLYPLSAAEKMATDWIQKGNKVEIWYVANGIRKGKQIEIL